MVKKVGQLIKEWQEALQAEIHHLKKYGSTKYLLKKGQLLSKEESYTYYFETAQSLRIPIGANIKVQWGSKDTNGITLSTEGKNVIVSINQYIGDTVSEAFLNHDPWELLEQLIERLEDLKNNKIKRARINRLIYPNETTKHPINQIKSKVHELMLRSQYNPVTYVWGPPGTGKTYTLARVAANKYINHKKILILAQSNQAVDVLMDEIAAFIKKKEKFNEGDILRYGGQANNQFFQQSITTNQLLQTFHPDLADKKNELSVERQLLKTDLSRSFSKRDSDRLLELESQLARTLEKIRHKEVEFVEDARIIGATLAKAASDSAIYEKEFDLVILDEVSQAYVPQVAFASTLAKRIIVCGDYKQLPAIASGRHPLINEWLREDIFNKSEVALSSKEGNLHPQLLLLNEQRRMHPDISAFTNKHIYHSLVNDHPSVFKSRTEMVSKKPFQTRASILVDVSFTGEHCLNERSSNSRMNIWQLLISFQVMYEAFLAGSRSIGYVTPYRAQSLMMELLLKDLLEKELAEADIISATVHRFQGSERDVMIFDSVDSYPQERPGMLLIGSDSERLINVAITRTRGKFVHVCNSAFIQNNISYNKTIRKLVDFQRLNGQGVTHNEIGNWIENQHPRLRWMHARKLEHLLNDILQAKSSIVLSMPHNGSLNIDWINGLNNRRYGVKLTLISNEPIIQLMIDESIDKTIPFPFVLIDQHILWLGIPVEGANRVRPPFVSVRLQSEAIGQYFFSQLPI